MCDTDLKQDLACKLLQRATGKTFHHWKFTASVTSWDYLYSVLAALGYQWLPVEGEWQRADLSVYR